MEQVAVKFARFCVIEVVYIEWAMGGRARAYQVRNRNLQVSQSELISSDNASEIASGEQVASYRTGTKD